MGTTINDPVTAVISTCNRGRLIAATIATILANDYDNFRVIVVDQSDNDDTRLALEQLADDNRLQYMKSSTKGVSVGRNLGIQAATSECIVITDDDCEVPATWLRDLVAAFEIDPHIGVVFGNVVPAPHDQAAGFIPAYVRTEPFLACTMRDKQQVEGISACMGLRRSVWQALGGFDEMLGAGAPFTSGGETDFAMRALLAGYAIYETPRVWLTHHGFRTWSQGDTLIDRYWYGTGAMFAKNLKCGHASVALLLVGLAWRWAFGRSRVAASLGARSYRWRRLVSFARGLVAGAVSPVERTTGHFRLGGGQDTSHASGYPYWPRAPYSRPEEQLR
jgi:GT2 family glycosyltransferase